MTNVLVTGASGFVGYHLVKRLSESGCNVRCLVRKRSDIGLLKQYEPHLAYGDIRDRALVKSAVHGVDVVYHAAGLTKALRVKDLFAINQQGSECVASCCAERDAPPTLVYLSSLAAAGPGNHVSADHVPRPVSAYGESKLAGEVAVSSYAGIVPTTIIRAPMILGEADRVGLNMFRSIARWGLHFVPARHEFSASVIHAEDLTNAAILAAARGRRIEPGDETHSGIYYAAADQQPSYAELGRMIGRALGRNETRIIYAPKSAVRGIAAISSAISSCLRMPFYLNLDKAREITAGSWTCSAVELKHDTGFYPSKSLVSRIEQTIQWYLDNGWLRDPKLSSLPTATSRRITSDKPLGQPSSAR